MKLSNLPEKSLAKVLKLSCSDELKQRLFSFGVTKGGVVSVEEISLAKQTMGIKVDETHLAMRLAEAELIEVELIKNTTENG